jgi:iron-sulfur cluster assembly protein
LRFIFVIDFLNMETTVNTPVSFTPSAVVELKRLLSELPADSGKMLRVGVKGGGCSGMTYQLEFDEQKEGDQLYELDGLPFLMNAAHEMYLYKMEIHWEGGLNSRGFTFHNPNATSTCGCGTSFAV